MTVPAHGAQRAYKELHAPFWVICGSVCWSTAHRFHPSEVRRRYGTVFTVGTLLLVLYYTYNISIVIISFRVVGSSRTTRLANSSSSFTCPRWVTQSIRAPKQNLLRVGVAHTRLSKGNGLCLGLLDLTYICRCARAHMSVRAQSFREIGCGVNFRVIRARTWFRELIAPYRALPHLIARTLTRSEEHTSELQSR